MWRIGEYTSYKYHFTNCSISDLSFSINLRIYVKANTFIETISSFLNLKKNKMINRTEEISELNSLLQRLNYFYSHKSDHNITDIFNKGQTDSSHIFVSYRVAWLLKV